jgi:hypothetical protein
MLQWPGAEVVVVSTAAAAESCGLDVKEDPLSESSS